ATPATLALFYSCVHPDDRGAMLARRGSKLESAASYQSEYRIVRSDGAVRLLHSWLDFAPRPDGTMHVFGTCQDITERKRAEAEIDRAREQPQVALNDLREVDRRKDEFLAMLSHELRNPLGPILNAVELLEQLPGDKDVGAQPRQVIARQARH